MRRSTSSSSPVAPRASPPRGEWLSADEAAALLGVTKATLYAYVSRGKLAAAPGATPQARAYRRSEVERLAGQRARGRRPREVARAALAWGLPVLESTLTLIEGQQLHYRGRSAVALAASASAEDVAALLWQCSVAEAFDAAAQGVPVRIQRQVAALEPLPLRERLSAAFALLQAHGAGPDPRGDARLSAGHAGTLLRLACAAALGGVPASTPLHAQFAAAWRLDRRAADAVRAALVLCADHELNASSFVARCVASTGADLAQAVLAGMAALSGGLHGGTTARVEAMWDELLRAQALRTGLQGRLSRGDDLPGFGHPLYPDGDPRAAAILARLPPGEARDLAVRITRDVCTATGRLPSLDFALVAVRRAVGAPEGGAYALFAVGRTIGWIAHALEQRESGALIRPRAAYTGLRPEDVEGPAPLPRRGPRSVFER